MRPMCGVLIVLLAVNAAWADQYDDLVALAQQCKLKAVQTEQARAAEAVAEQAVATAQQARAVALAAYDQQAFDAELLRLSGELQSAVTTQDWTAFMRLMGELDGVNRARDQAKSAFDDAQAAVNAASAALIVADRQFNNANEERKALLKKIIDAAEVIARQRG